MDRSQIPYRCAQSHEVREFEHRQKQQSRSSTQPVNISSFADGRQLNQGATGPEYQNPSTALENSPGPQSSGKNKKITSSGNQTPSAMPGPSQVIKHIEINQPTRVIVIGNPGVGKSTIQNTLMREAVFKSGISLGGGLTKSTAMFPRGGLTYVDTPGLDDMYNRKTAAREISAALHGPGAIKLIFVTALEAGRVRSADVCTLHTVITALREVVGDMKNRYALIINKCEHSVAQKLRKKDCRATRESVLGPFLAVEMMKHVEVIGFEAKHQGQSRALLSNHTTEKLQGMIERMTAIHLPSKPVVRLDVQNVEETARLMEEVSKFNKTFEQGQKSGKSQVARNLLRVQTYPQHHGMDHGQKLRKLKAQMDRYSKRAGVGHRSRFAEVWDALFHTHIG